MHGFEKQPSDMLDYDIILSDWLEGDEVEACDVTAPEGMTLDHKTIFADRVKLWLAGGEHRKTYKFSALIKTEMGRHKEVDFQVRVIER